MGTVFVVLLLPWIPSSAAAMQAAACSSCLPPPPTLRSSGTAAGDVPVAANSGGGLLPPSLLSAASTPNVLLVLPTMVIGATMAASLQVRNQPKRMKWKLSRRASNIGSTPSSGNQGAILGNIFDAAMQAGGGATMGFGGPGMPYGGPRGGGQKQLTPEQQETRDRVLRSIREFRMRPRDVKAYLDRFVIEQKEAKKVLAVALCDHYNWARRCIGDEKLRATNYTKPNILILGPTGSGKTYLVRTLAKMLGVPFVKADATKFSETGIVGEDAEDVVRGLVDAAGGDAELAQYGIVYIDEVDKIATGGGGGGRGGWSGRQVQSNFLKIMEETEVSLQSGLAASLGNVLGGGSKEGQTISTKFMLFIFSGAFNSLNDRIKDRIESGKIGFLVDEDAGQTLARVGEGDTRAPTGSDKGARSYLHLAETSDFVEAGLEPEFIGRVPVRVAVNALDANDLYQILTTAEDSIVKQYENEFEGYGIQLKTERSALRRIAELATEEKTGARALVTILERSLRDFKFELPSTTSSELTLSAGLLADPRTTLNELLSTPERVSADLQQWIEELERNSNVRVELADDVRDRVVHDCVEAKSSAEALLERRFRATGVVDGLKRIHEATEGKVAFFSINMTMYEHPEEEMEKWRQSLAGLGSTGNGSEK